MKYCFDTNDPGRAQVHVGDNNRLMLWQNHIRRTSKAGNKLGRQEIYTHTICKDSNQFITYSP